MALENIFPPLPSEAIMGAGALSMENGGMQFWPLLIAGTLGTLAGNYMWYWIGVRVGYERLGPIVDRWGRWLTLEWEDVERAVRFFRKHGQWAVFVLRATPVMPVVPINFQSPSRIAHLLPHAKCSVRRGNFALAS